MKRLQEFFNLTYKERNGFLVFTIFIVVLMLLPSVWSYIRKPYPVSTYAIQVFPESEAKHYSTRDSQTKVKKAIHLRPFNPNRLPSEEWAKFGLTEKQIAVIHRYEDRGGVFVRKEDVRKLYVIDEALYQQLAPFIRIPTKENTSSSNKIDNVSGTSSWRVDTKTQQDKKAIRIDVNVADTTDWKMLRGIGSVYATRIVRYRELLGGFYQIGQLREVYGLPEERLEEWLPQLYLESPIFRRLRVNHLDAHDLQKHPYITKGQATHIVNYRKQHGPFQSIDDMRKIVTLDTDFFVKIESYLDFQ